MSADRAPSRVWSVSRTDINTYARTLPYDKILVVGPDVDDAPALAGIALTRRQARTLAKRINECLDATATTRTPKRKGEGE